MGEAPAGLTFALAPTLFPLAPGTRGLTPVAFSNGVLPDALGALPPETPPVVSVARGTATFTSGAPLPTVLPRTEGAIGDGLTGWPAPAAGDPPGPATFALGTPLPTVLPRTEGVIGDGLTVIGWPTPVGAAPGVTVPAFTFGTTPLGMERCAPPPTPTPPPTPIPPSEPPALP